MPRRRTYTIKKAIPRNPYEKNLIKSYGGRLLQFDSSPSVKKTKRGWLSPYGFFGIKWRLRRGKK